MKAFTERRPRVLGAMAVAVMAVLVIGIIFFNRNIFNSGYQVSARFSNAAGIGSGTDVLVAGVKVGSVTGVKVDGNAVDATMSINHGTWPRCRWRRCSAWSMWRCSRCRAGRPRSVPVR